MSSLFGVRFLQDLHPSLNNIEKVRYLLAKFQAQKAPHGTNIIGAMYELQRNKELGSYLREISILPGNKIFLVCMTYRQAELLQDISGFEIDMSYKRIAGDILQFELNHLHPGSRQTLTLARVFTNAGESTDVYHRIFVTIDNTVVAYMKEKTRPRKTDSIPKSGLRWKHIDGDDSNLTYVKADWDRAQAKGLGLYLHDLDPTQTWQEHLSQVYVGCLVHFYRNVRKQKACDEVKLLMKSLPGLNEKEDVDKRFSNSARIA